MGSTPGDPACPECQPDHLATQETVAQGRFGDRSAEKRQRNPGPRPCPRRSATPTDRVGPGAPPPRKRRWTAFPHGIDKQGATRDGSGLVCKSTPRLKPGAGARTGASLARRPEWLLCRGRPSSRAVGRWRNSGNAGQPARIGGGPTCVSPSRVVRAFQYGSESDRGGPSGASGRWSAPLTGASSPCRPQPVGCKPVSGANRVSSVARL